ncbi:uncharacterized [Tachysurus ichikawai]
MAPVKRHAYEPFYTVVNGNRAAAKEFNINESMDICFFALTADVAAQKKYEISAVLLTLCLPADTCCSTSESPIPNRCLARYYCNYSIWQPLTDDTISSTPTRERLLLI